MGHRSGVRAAVIMGALVACFAGASPAGAFVYALDYGPNQMTGGGIWQYGQDSNGTLTALSPASIATPTAYARGVAISPDGKSVYIVLLPHPGSGEIAQYNVEANGTLSPKTPATVSAGTTPGPIAVAPNGKSVYALDAVSPGLVWEYDVNPAGGTLTPKSTASTSGTTVCWLGGTSLAVSPDSKYVYVARNNPGCLAGQIAVLSADASGELTEKSEANTVDQAQGVVVSPDGSNVYAIDGSLGHDDVYQFTVGTGGALTAKTPASVNAGMVGNGFAYNHLAISPDGHNLYVSAETSFCNNSGEHGEILQYAVGAGGLLSAPPASTVATGEPNSVTGIALSSDGKSLYASQSGSCNVSGGTGAVLQYDVSASGSLTAKAPAQVTAGLGMVSIAASPVVTNAVHHTLTVSVTGSGLVTGGGVSCPATCSKSYQVGTSVALTAAASSGSTFAGWTGAGCSGTGVCNVTMSADQSVTATFTAKPPPPRCTLTPQSDKVLLKAPKHGKRPKIPPGELAAIAKCDQAVTATLRGTLTELVGKKPKHGKQRTKTFTLGPTSGSVPAGKATVLTLKLPKAALSALAAGARESVVLSLTPRDANGTGQAGATIPSLKGVR